MARLHGSRDTTGDRRRSLKGQVMILFAVGAIALIGMLALAVDVGFLMAERRQVQAAADSAALAAARAELDQRSDIAFQSAREYGARNANVPQANVVPEYVNWPASGSTSNTDFVQVTITKDVDRFFVGALYKGPWQVQATAIAGVDRTPKPYALVALNCPGIALNGGIQINIEGNGSAISNCDITNTGNSSIFSVGGSIDAVGTIQSNTNWVAPDGINSGAQRADDPLMNATPPPIPSVSRDVPSCLGDNVCVIQPGRYTNKSFTVGPNKLVCMMPGLYYLDGNTRIRFQSQGSTLTNKRPHSIGENSYQCPSGIGGGVQIYIAPGSTAAIEMGNGNLDISTWYPAPANSSCNTAMAPYTGAPCGMVLWIANGSTFNGGGNAIAKFEGVVYAPQSHVTLQGTPGSHGLQVIVGQLSMGGNAEFNIAYRQYVTIDRPAVYLVQ